MGQFLNKKLVIGLVIFIITVVIIGKTNQERTSITFVEKIVRDTTFLLQSIVNKPVSFFADMYNYKKDMDNVYEENKLLKSELSRYVEAKKNIAILEKENKKLKKITELSEEFVELEVINATVVWRAADLWRDTITINKGSEHGISPNMAVQTTDGLIGIVKTTAKFSSTVDLLTNTDNKTRVSAEVIGENSFYGVIQGYNANLKSLKLYNLDISSDISVGANVISSGQGGVFPKGILIGKIKKVSTSPTGLSKEAEVESLVNFNDLNFVQVIFSKQIMTENDRGSESEGEL